LIALGIAAPTWAQNPCTPPPPALTVLTSTNHAVHGSFPDFTATFGGAPKWTETELFVVERGTGPSTGVPVASVSVTKASWSLVAGTADCYRLSTVGAFLFGVEPDKEYDLYARTANGATKGAWSNPVPFGRPGPLPAPTALLITP